jgi:hypothetical protein
LEEEEAGHANHGMRLRVCPTPSLSLACLDHSLQEPRVCTTPSSLPFSLWSTSITATLFLLFFSFWRRCMHGLGKNPGMDPKLASLPFLSLLSIQPGMLYCTRTPLTLPACI